MAGRLALLVSVILLAAVLLAAALSWVLNDFLFTDSIVIERAAETSSTGR